jgi:hypothetical protein
MSSSAPDRDLAAVIERRLRESLSRNAVILPAVPPVVTIDTVRVSVPESATNENVAQGLSAGVADALRERGVC